MDGPDASFVPVLRRLRRHASAPPELPPPSHTAHRRDGPGIPPNAWQLGSTRLESWWAFWWPLFVVRCKRFARAVAVKIVCFAHLVLLGLLRPAQALKNGNFLRSPGLVGQVARLQKLVIIVALALALAFIASSWLLSVITSQHAAYMKYYPAFYDDFDHKCSTGFLHYPQYYLVLGMPYLAPPLFGLSLSHRTVASAYRLQLSCYQPDHRKALRHPGLGEYNLSDIATVLFDTQGKLQAGTGYRKLIREAEPDFETGKSGRVPISESFLWHAIIVPEDVVPSARRSFQSCKPCDLEEALWTAALTLLTPSSRWPALPTTLEEAERMRWCPCSIREAWQKFSYLGNFAFVNDGFRSFGLRWIYNDDHLPPKGLNHIWMEDEIWAAALSPSYNGTSPVLSRLPGPVRYLSRRISNYFFETFVTRLRKYGRAGVIGGLFAPGIEERIESLTCAEQRKLVLQGWLDVDDSAYPYHPCVRNDLRYLRTRSYLAIRGVEKLWRSLGWKGHLTCEW